MQVKLGLNGSSRVVELQRSIRRSGNRGITIRLLRQEQRLSKTRKPGIKNTMHGDIFGSTQSTMSSKCEGIGSRIFAQSGAMMKRLLFKEMLD